MRLPIRPPIAAPAIPAAMRSPVPPPSCEPISPPATAPTSVPVFSFGPCPVSGVPLHAAVDIATSAAAPRRTKYISSPRPTLTPSQEAGDPPIGNAEPARYLMAQIGAKLCSHRVNGMFTRPAERAPPASRRPRPEDRWQRRAWTPPLANDVSLSDTRGVQETGP